VPFACALHANVTEHLRRRCDALAEPPQFALEGRAGEALLSRTPASVDLDSDALISALPEGDASSTVPTPRALGWRSLTRTKPSSDVPRRLRGHQCVGSDRPPAAMSNTLRCARGLDPRKPGSRSYDRFRTARPPPGRLFSYRAVATFVASGTRRAASTPQASPRTRSPRPHRGGAFNAVALVPSRLGHPNPPRLCSARGRGDRDAYDRKLRIHTRINEHPPCVRLPRPFRAFARRFVVPRAVHDALSASAIRETRAWALSSHPQTRSSWPASDVPSPRRFTPRTRFRVRAMPPRPRPIPPAAP